MPTGIPSTHPVLPALREAVEQKFGKSLRQQNNIWDFIGTIQNRLNEDTIRRLWGLRKDGYRSIRPATLDILCEYIGAKDWQSFVAAYQQQAQIESELNPHTHQITADDPTARRPSTAHMVARQRMRGRVFGRGGVPHRACGAFAHTLRGRQVPLPSVCSGRTALLGRTRAQRESAGRIQDR